MPIAPLTQAQIATLTQVATQHGPGGGTPTAPALQGAIDYAKQWVLQNPTHTTIVLFATDGDPTRREAGPPTSRAGAVAGP